MWKKLKVMDRFKLDAELIDSLKKSYESVLTEAVDIYGDGKLAGFEYAMTHEFVWGRKF
jgi:hypothetical protein